MWLVVGLGNPGEEYARTRHNVGFMVVDELSGLAKAGPAKAKFGAELREGVLGGERVLFCKPMEFMNTSGNAVAKAAGFWKIPLDHTVVVHDELDIPFGRLRLGLGGGPGGHNGLRSLISTIGPEFLRVRVGISRPPGGRDAAGYVLAGFSKDEQKELPFVVGEAKEAVLALLAKGLATAMNKFNVKKSDGKSEN